MRFSEYINEVVLLENDDISIMINYQNLIESYSPPTLIDKSIIDNIYRYLLYSVDHSEHRLNRDIDLDNPNSPTFIPSISQLKDTVKLCSPCIRDIIKNKEINTSDRIFLRNLPEQVYIVLKIDDVEIQKMNGKIMLHCFIITHWGGGHPYSTQSTKVWIDYNGKRCYKQSPIANFSKGSGVVKGINKLNPELKKIIKTKGTH